MAVKLSNNASSTLAGGINDSVTSLAVQSGDGAKFPSLSTGDWFPLTVADALGNREIMRVTARTGAVMTVLRAQEGTVATAFSSGASVDLRFTAAAFNEAYADIKDLIDAVDARSLETEARSLMAAPPGKIMEFGAATAPDGWLKCDGSAISRSAYSALFSAIGTVFGAGNGTTTFNVPDFRGEFIRGWDDGRGVDSGRSFGSTQTGSIEGHVHPIDAVSVTVGSGGTAGFAFNEGSAAPLGQRPTASAGTGETRPRNLTALICIKY